MKKILLYTLCLLFGLSGTSQTVDTKIGDLIDDGTGNKGIVFWINPEKTKGYMMNIIDASNSVQFAKDSHHGQGLPTKTRSECIFDMDGYTHTLYLKSQTTCSNADFNIACLADIENGWFVPAAGQWNLFISVYPLIRQKMIEEYGGTDLGWYWTSTQASLKEVWEVNFRDFYGGFGADLKIYWLAVRTAKEFSIPPQMTHDTTLSYRWNTGDTITNFFTQPPKDSLFSVTATSSEGCAATAVKQIFVSDATPKEIFDTICVGYAYANNGFTLPADSNRIVGTTTHQKTLSNGDCDVSVTLHLTKHKTDSTAIVDSFCSGKSYVHNGVIYQSAGDYVQFLTSENGCDSVLHLQLSLKNPVTTSISEDACGQYVWNNQYYYTSGIYSQTFVAANGCDSIVNKKITITKRSLGYLELDSCKQATYKNTVFFNDTTFTDTLVNSAGCDSLLTVNLSILKSDFDTVYPTAACDSVSYRGKYYFADTICTDTLLGGTCGTIRTAFLTVPKHSLGYLELNACDQITYNANTFLNDTTFVETLVNSVGCDSLLTVNLTVNPSYFDTTNLSEMDSVVFEEKTYFRDTILTFLHQTSAGCDSILEVHISVKESPDPPPNDSIEAEIVVYWHKVLAVPNRKNLDELKFATYYWYKDGILLPQSNKDWIEVGSPIPVGKYNVSIVYDDEQIAYLERIFDKPFGVSAYPNPVQTTEELTIEAYGNAIKRIEIFDLNGVLQKLPIRVNGALFVDFQTSGIYILKIHLDNQVVETIKIVVQ